MDVKANGIDISKYQGNIDWNTLKGKIDFAIIRCGYGKNIVSQDDPYFKRNADECTRLGIPFGVYLYSYATDIESAKSEIAHVLRLVQNYKLEYPIYLDIEDKSQSALPREDLTNIIVTFCEGIENAGYYVGIYANLNWWKNILTSDRLDAYDKWIAQWNDTLNYNGNDVGMWQYTNQENIEGIAGRVDGDKAFLDYPTIIREKGLNHLDKTPSPNVPHLKYKVGDRLILNGYLYRDSYGNGQGKYEDNKEVTITLINDKEGASKPYNVDNGLGWVAENNLSPIVSSDLKIGDPVRIIKTGKASSDGTGKTAWGILYKRQILNIFPDRAYPYQVGNEKGTTGFYKRNALEKL